MKDLDQIDLYKKKLVSSPDLHPFNQTEAIKQYNQILDQEDQLSINGNCFGLCLDFARHVESHRNLDRQPDYINKLQRKMSTLSPNFGKRVAQYQEFLNLDPSSLNSIRNTDDFLSNFCSHSDHVIGLCFYQKGMFDAESHILAIEPVLDPGKNIKGYRIFDPNCGIFDFSKHESITDNLALANETLNDLMKYYELLNFKHSNIIDLSEKVKKFSLTKQRDEDFSKDQKYLDGSPNLPDKELSLVLKYALEKSNHKIINNLIRNYGNEFSPFTMQYIVNRSIKNDDFETLRNLLFNCNDYLPQIISNIQDDESQKALPIVKAFFLLAKIATSNETQEINLREELSHERIEVLEELVKQSELINNPTLISKIEKILPNNDRSIPTKLSKEHRSKSERVNPQYTRRISQRSVSN